jgi:hypothetical protein
MVGTVICELGTKICDIDIINVRFYLLEIRYPYEYCRITIFRGGRNILNVPNNFTYLIRVRLKSVLKAQVNE